MRKTQTALVMLFVLGLGAGDAIAANHTFTWTWPTTRTDGSTLALSSIGNAVVYDTSVPVAGQPGTAVVCSPALTFPPTAATASCVANVASGHSFVVTVSDTASPPDVSAVSNTVSLPFTPPSAVTNLAVQ